MRKLFSAGNLWKTLLKNLKHFDLFIRNEGRFRKKSRQYSLLQTSRSSRKKLSLRKSLRELNKVISDGRCNRVFQFHFLMP